MAKYALCCGINDYPGAGSDLQGCVNDAREWTGVLRDRGYEVRTLLDAAATKAEVLGNLVSIISQARWGDRIVFTYSGHGSWVPDKDGDEADGRDEVLVCHDFAGGGLLSDDELHCAFQGVKFGVRAVIVSDSCHSGTMQRLLRRDATPAAVPRFLPPSVLGIVSEEEAVRREDAPRVSPPRLGPVLLSGCADHEFSYDAYIKGRFNGALTRAAIDTLTGRNPGSYQSWWAAIRRLLPSDQWPQSPQLQGTTYQKRLRPFD